MSRICTAVSPPERRSTKTRRMVRRRVALRPKPVPGVRQAVFRSACKRYECECDPHLRALSRAARVVVLIFEPSAGLGFQTYEPRSYVTLADLKDHGLLPALAVGEADRQVMLARSCSSETSVKAEWLRRSGGPHAGHTILEHVDFLVRNLDGDIPGKGKHPRP